MTELYVSDEKCCGCEACRNICPKQAVTMRENTMGFVYPVVDESKCIDCGLCKSVCIYENNVQKAKTLVAFAASSKSKQIIRKASSGGVFSVCAENFLRNGGVVYGAAYARPDYVKHIRIDSVDELWQIQGSKYVQSEIGNTYQKAKEDLCGGRKVLYTGTPCQIAGLKSFLKKDYENLFTIDVICHGVPSQRMFQDYIATISTNTIEQFEFRDKTRGWREFFITWIEKGKKKRLHNLLSSYYQLFLTGEIYRENCYSCQFACPDRVSDITLGDFWGFEKAHPEMKSDRVWKEQNLRGISCVLANSTKGIKLFDDVKSEVYWFDSSFDSIAAYNGQLREPSKHTEFRNQIMRAYLENGYEDVDRLFKSNVSRKQRIASKIKARIPLELKIKIKKLL